MYPNFYQNRNYTAYKNAQNYPINNSYQSNQNLHNSNQTDDRFLGLFAVPFLLGGVTGALIAPRRPYPVPYPVPYSPAPYPVPYQSYNYYYR